MTCTTTSCVLAGKCAGPPPTTRNVVWGASGDCTGDVNSVFDMPASQTCIGTCAGTGRASAKCLGVAGWATTSTCTGKPMKPACQVQPRAIPQIVLLSVARMSWFRPDLQTTCFASMLQHMTLQSLKDANTSALHGTATCTHQLQNNESLLMKHTVGLNVHPAAAAGGRRRYGH